MKKLISVIVRFQIWRDNRGQDLIEYALMAGFVAVSAGALMPNISTSISTVFSKVGSVMTGAASSSGKRRFNTVWKIIDRLRRDCAGQDLIEYALMAGFVAVSAGAILPSVATSISTIFSNVGSVVALAAS